MGVLSVAQIKGKPEGSSRRLKNKAAGQKRLYPSKLCSNAQQLDELAERRGIMLK
jgi:hypothetical protein